MAAVDWKKILALLGSGIVVYAGMRYLLPIAIPFLLGWFLASMVLPAARWMEKKWRIPRGIGGGFLIGLLTLFLAVGAWKLLALLVMQLGNLLDKLGLLAERLDGILNTCCQVVESYTGISAESIRQFLVYQAGRLQEQVQNNMEASWMGYFVTVIKGAITLVGGVIIVAIFGTLVVKDMEAFRERMNRGRITGKIMRVGRKICVAGGRYLKAQVCIMSVVGLVCMAGFWLLKNPYFVVAGVCFGGGLFSSICGSGSGAAVFGAADFGETDGDSSCVDAGVCVWRLFSIWICRIFSGTSDSFDYKSFVGRDGKSLL